MTSNRTELINDVFSFLYFGRNVQLPLAGLRYKLTPLCICDMAFTSGDINHVAPKMLPRQRTVCLPRKGGSDDTLVLLVCQRAVEMPA